MNKTLLSLVAVSFLMIGCSHKEVRPSTVPSSVKTDKKSIEELAVLLKFNEAVEFQNRRSYANAIQIYDSIISYYSGKENRGILSSVYINKFECSLLINKGYRQNDIEDYLKQFANDPQKLMAFEVLYILDGAKRKSMDAEVERWSSKYRNHRLNDWTFKYIDDWIRRQEDVNKRNRLNRYVSIFKKSL